MKYKIGDKVKIKNNCFNGGSWGYIISIDDSGVIISGGSLGTDTFATVIEDIKKTL